MTRAFVEDKQFEQGNSSTDDFYATGSSPAMGNDMWTFAKPLRDKDQIKIKFPVTSKTAMLPNSSSIYYFNVKNGSWNIPSKALGDHVGPFSKFSYRTVWAYGSGTYGYQSTRGTFYIEDKKGFNAYGLATASGSLEIFRQSYPKPNQTIEIIGSNATPSELIPYMTRDYVKSIQRSQIYDATNEEVFSIDIDKPFLLEKAVFSIPIAVGKSWLDDRTISTLARAIGNYNETQPMPPFEYFDDGGPAVTLSLFCQKNYGTGFIRDLILSGTFTNYEDSISSANSRVYPSPTTEGGSEIWIVVLESAGLKDPSCVVSGSSNTYTGSIAVKTQCAVSNGAAGSLSYVCLVYDSNQVFFDDSYIPYVSNTSQFLNHIEKIMRKETIRFNELFSSIGGAAADSPITSIDPFGRGMTGFSPSGGSIFGGEHVSSQFNLTKVISKNDFLPNPLYSADELTIQKTIQQISSSLKEAFSKHVGTFPVPVSWVYGFTGVNPLSSFAQSPYLLNPGDKLVLAVSKTRPAISSSVHNVPNPQAADVGFQILKNQVNVISGLDKGHDITLSTGSIDITFYGSYVREGNSYVP